jgi:hypothetical protein
MANSDDPKCSICSERCGAHSATADGPLTHPCETRGEGSYVFVSLRVFAHELFREARNLVGGNFEMRRPVVRLITMTLQCANEIGIDPVLTQAHLEAVQAVMHTLKIINSGNHFSDHHSIKDTISGDWAIILVEALRITAFGESSHSTNSPNLQNMPRQRLGSVLVQTVERIMKNAIGDSIPCLGCLQPLIARHVSDCPKRMPQPKVPA